MNKAPATAKPEDPLFVSYVDIARSLAPEFPDVSLLDAKLNSLGETRGFDAQALAHRAKSLWREGADPAAVAVEFAPQRWVIVIPLLYEGGELLGALCLQQSRTLPVTQPGRLAEALAHTLKPLLDCIYRELVTRRPVKSRVNTLTERTAELEWLFKVTSNLKGAAGDRGVIEELVTAATERMGSAFGVLWLPGKRLCIECSRDRAHAETLRDAFAKTKQHLLTWVERQNRPLVVNSSSKSGRAIGHCKILAVPVMRESGLVLGILAFYAPASAASFASRHTFLARHLGRQVGSVIDSQFDLMTGLYTRVGLQQTYGNWDDPSLDDRVILHVDIDHMHVVNELLGFEVGNELIVRIADLCAPPVLPEGTIAARIAADRFVLVLPTADIAQAVEVAERMRLAAKQLAIGPGDTGVDISVSCGVASLLPMPQGLDRGIAAAELACKTAKQRGRDRVEVYTLDDNTMMRSHGDAIAIGQLRSALKSDRLLLYAQPIVLLRDRSAAAGYELLLRVRDVDGSLVTPGPLIEVAARFQLLPTVDRWVTRRAFEMLAPYRSMLDSRSVGISINVSGQSIGDETFVEYLSEQIKEVRLPAGCITIEITEQAAVTNLARANRLIRRLKTFGVQFALDDFGTGTNSLSALKQLQISRVKIDGSFVRDIATDRSSQATVRAIIELAKGMSIDTVAEYVETLEIAKEVKRLGVDYAQGYAFGRPEPLSDILERLKAEESQRLHRLFLES